MKKIKLLIAPMALIMLLFATVAVQANPAINLAPESKGKITVVINDTSPLITHYDAQIASTDVLPADYALPNIPQTNLKENLAGKAEQPIDVISDQNKLQSVTQQTAKQLIVNDTSPQFGNTIASNLTLTKEQATKDDGTVGVNSNAGINTSNLQLQEEQPLDVNQSGGNQNSGDGMVLKDDVNINSRNATAINTSNKEQATKDDGSSGLVVNNLNSTTTADTTENSGQNSLNLSIENRGAENTFLGHESITFCTHNPRNTDDGGELCIG